MKILKNKWVWIALGITVVAIILDLKSSTYPLISKSVSITENSKTTNKDIIQVPEIARILSLLAILLYGFSTSIIISIFITQYIEQARQSEHEAELKALNNAISINVFDTLFKTIVPKEVFDALKNEVIQAKLIRRDHNWIHDITCEGKMILLKQTLQYRLTNSSHEAIYDPIVAITEPDTKILSEADVLERVSCTINGKQVVSYDRSNSREGVTQELDELGQTKTTINFMVPAGETVDVTLIWMQRYRDCDECGPCKDGYFTALPIINGQLTVNKPSNFKYILFQSMTSPLKLVLEEPDRLMYKLTGAVLPGQGFIYTFGPNDKKNKPAIETPVVSGTNLAANNVNTSGGVA